ncbi:MAG TPA: MFS transporter [Lacunisphaera sp.]|nr:MFS transporter [Lacunisphaera sp.]
MTTPAPDPTQNPGDSPATAATPLARRRWWRIMPMIFITYSLAYLDRANFGLAAAAGMARDLRITETMSSLIGSLFLLGYFAFQVPGAIYAERYSVRRLIIASMLVWGACSTLTGIIPNAYGLLVVRFLTGVAEAAVMPAMLIYISRWFSRSERSMANTLFILGNPVTVLWMSVLSGYLIAVLSWRWMFILEGLPAVLWAFVAWVPATDQPDGAAWLTPAEKTALARTLAAERTATIAVRSYGDMFRSPRLLLLGVQYACWSAGVFGFVLWLPSILVHGKSMGMVRTGFLAAVPYLLAIAAMLVVSYLAKRSANPMTYVWTCLLAGGVAFGGLLFLGDSDYWLSYALLILAGAAMYAPYGPYWAVVADLLPKNVAGGAMALVNSMGALGGFVGSYLIGYLNGTTGSLKASYILLTVAMVAAAAIIRAFALPTSRPDGPPAHRHKA